MTGDPPRRWPDDSPEENFAVHQATEGDGIIRWAAEQKLRPLTDTLAGHGVQPGGGKGWAGPLVLPSWWDEVPEPGAPCPWCQRPSVPAPCGECRAGRAADVDPPSLWAWWASLAPAQRRLHIAASYSADPWSGRVCTIRMEWTDVDADGKVSTTYPLYFGCAPAGIYWGARRRG